LLPLKRQKIFVIFDHLRQKLCYPCNVENNVDMGTDESPA